MSRMPVSMRTVVPFHPDCSGAGRRCHNPLAHDASGEKPGGDDHGDEQFRHTLEHRALLGCNRFPDPTRVLRIRYFSVSFSLEPVLSGRRRE